MSVALLVYLEVKAKIIMPNCIHFCYVVFFSAVLLRVDVSAEAAKNIFGKHESEARKRRWRLLWRRIISSLDLYGLKNYLPWTPVVWGNISRRSELTSNCLPCPSFSLGRSAK